MKGDTGGRLVTDEGYKLFLVAIDTITVPLEKINPGCIVMVRCPPKVTDGELIVFICRRWKKKERERETV